jgi:protein-tyrosine-phosphatase
MAGGKVFNVLFLCTHNSARSIVAEVIIDYVGRGKFKGFSAGSVPGFVAAQLLGALIATGLARWLYRTPEQTPATDREPARPSGERRAREP